MFLYYTHYEALIFDRWVVGMGRHEISYLSYSISARMSKNLLFPPWMPLKWTSFFECVKVNAILWALSIVIQVKTFPKFDKPLGPHSWKPCDFSIFNKMREQWAIEIRHIWFSKLIICIKNHLQLSENHFLFSITE